MIQSIHRDKGSTLFKIIDYILVAGEICLGGKVLICVEVVVLNVVQGTVKERKGVGGYVKKSKVYSRHRAASQSHK